MNRFDLVKIFFRSFFIQGSLNFRRMQNMGFAFAMMPLFRRRQAVQPKSNKPDEHFLMRHVELFNTHPCMASAVAGSVARVEEDLWREENPDARQVVLLKNAMAGPYAAIGDAFFWGSLRPFAAIVAVSAALAGCGWAPVIFLALYDPISFWVRGKGFFEGYRFGREGFRYIQSLNLPAANPRIRWISVLCLAALAAWWSMSERPASLAEISGLIIAPVMLAMTLVCTWAIRKRWSPLILMYAMAFILLLVSI